MDGLHCGTSGYSRPMPLIEVATDSEHYENIDCFTPNLSNRSRKVYLLPFGLEQYENALYNYTYKSSKDSERLYQFIKTAAH